MSTAAIPDAEPLPPLLPTTVGWRWPWLLATLALTATAGVLFVRTLPMAVEFGADSGSQYTAWVYAPRAGVFFLSFAVGIVTTFALCFRRWRHLTRNVIFGVFAFGSLAGGWWAVHESTARRHIAPHLATAVDAFRNPTGATSAGPAVVGTEGAFPYDGVLGEPGASRAWILPTNSATAACADIHQMITGERGWEAAPGWPCGFKRRQGRFSVRISDDQLGSEAHTITVSAYPND